MSVNLKSGEGRRELREGKERKGEGGLREKKRREMDR